jgi:IMP cyclohydrolase
VLPHAVAIVPKPSYENDIQKNPYIAYNCLRLVGNVAVATNGSHTDPIAEKIASGMNLRDALATVLLALDYEHDQLNTPRIAALVQAGSDRGWLGIVRADALFVREFRIEPGTAYYVCTYEHNEPLPERVDRTFDVASANEACQYMLSKGVFAALERPVSAACALAGPSGFETAIADAPQ